MERTKVNLKKRPHLHHLDNTLDSSLWLLVTALQKETYLQKHGY